MANVFNDLALQYVVSTDSFEVIAEKAAAAIEGSANVRVAVGLWVASINRWMPRSLSYDGKESGDEDDDIVVRAKSLDFLADTLTLLKKDKLKTDQVKLLIGFFNSLFSSDHRAGIAASAKSLRQLVTMKAFSPASGNDIFISVTELGEDFKRQTPATRLEIYELILSLLGNATVANDIEYQHGEMCGFMTALLDICKNERDPLNLMKWFEIQKVFLQNFSPIKDVTTEVFKAFSAYFPITLRASATPSGITVEQLKGALRSCFASHYRIADLAIPFLLSKLDQGEAVTVAVRVDILQTLEACLAQYQHAQQGVVPYMDLIWSSLKYEVRNGEIEDSIKATLKTVDTLAKRLEGGDLEKLLSIVWADLAEDLSNPTNSAQAGRLLTAIAGATPQSFSLSTPRILTHVKSSLKQTKHSGHQLVLLSLLNCLLEVRQEFSVQGHWGFLQDEIFGNALFEEVYHRVWKESVQTSVSSDQIDVVKKIMEGMAKLVSQYSNSGGHARQLCSDAICLQVFSSLGAQCVISPLKGTPFFRGTNETEEANLRNAAEMSLQNIAPRYPQGFRQLLQQFLSSLTELTNMKSLAFSHNVLHEVTSRLARIGCTDLGQVTKSPISNFVSLINTLLDSMHVVLKMHPDFWTVLIASIHLAVVHAFDALTTKAPKEDTRRQIFSAQSNPSPEIVQQRQKWLPNFKAFVDGLPEIDADKQGRLEVAIESLEKLDGDISSVYYQFLGYCLFVLAQIYRRFTAIKSDPGPPNGSISPMRAWAVGLSTDFELNQDRAEPQDRFLHQVARLATIIVCELSPEEQLMLSLWKEAFVMFRGHEATPDNPEVNFATAAIDPSPLTLSAVDVYRTAPLSMGILQGLWPASMSEVYQKRALLSLCDTLTRPPFSCSVTARASLDTILTVLSNKYDFKTPDPDDQWGRAQHTAGSGFERVMRRAASNSPDVSTSLAIFKSVLHFLAGDVVRHRTEPAANWLLQLVCANAPTEITNGGQLAQCFEILVSPKEYFEEGHAILKRLRGQWIYFQTVQPWLKDCFSPPSQDDRVATNRSIVTFSILKHLDFTNYVNDVGQVTRVIIRSLSMFKISKNMNSALHILLQILDMEPESLKEHLNPLISNTLSVYHKARSVSNSLQYVDKKSTVLKEAAKCRVSTLEFLKQVPNKFERRHLLSFRQNVNRGLSTACGDPVREVRRLAQDARREWQVLS